MKLFFFFAAVLLTLEVKSQSISGKVLEPSGIPLSFANVLLLTPSDSSLIKGAVTDTLGNFTIFDIPDGNYLISASMMGYKQVYLPLISNEKKAVEGITLQLQEDSQQLEEVMVVEKRPFVEQYIDKMVVNVSNSIIASGSTALEVLEKAPGVTIDRQNNSLRLRGKDGVIVQMDGKQTYLSMEDLVILLSTMSSDNIDQIELITNPSAKYDAAGNSGIINIKLIENNDIGTNGSISVGVGTGRFERERGSLQINHRAKKINVFGNYSANAGGGYFDLDSRQFIENGGQQNYIDQLTYIVFDNWGQNAKAGADYFLGKNTTIGIVWTGFWSNNGEDGTASSDFERNEGINYLETSTAKQISSISTNNVGNLNFQHKFGENGGQLTADFDIGQFKRQYSNTLQTDSHTPEEPSQPREGLITEMPTTITIRTAKADYSRVVFNNWNMEAGLKTAFVESDNDLTLFQGEEGNLIVDPILSNHFIYTENVNAAYISFSGKLGESTQAQMGLRAEHTISEGKSLNTENTVKRNYLNVFPSVFISNKLSENHTLVLSYSYRINRPSYQFLNPARSYVDPFLYSRGNAFLQPEYTHSLELKHGFKDKLYTSIGASFVSDLIFYLIQPVDSIRTERTPDNVGTSQSYNITMSYPLAIMKGWNAQLNFTGLYSRFNYLYQENPIIVEQISSRINMSNTFAFQKGWTGELTGWISSPSIQALARAPWLGSLDLGIQKSFSQKFKARLSIQDIFHTNKFIGKIDVPGFNSDYHLQFDTRVALINLTYTLGNQDLKAARQRKLGSEEESQRTN
ncbi:outer membrane beta-barrel protein [Algoriphagus halophilus]|uniref:Outer membrane receptor proteins, mostly Fe transport n=1 Tax=Algoriphagus halophilus TaxID=226505 RepID=A0A1N6D8T1_9BACT|nr:outer membrane beta-barrel protein [Algoriphagus halophilus]SIN67084.1 Outer membrane receptor proteins, mostly Fe transport [Algoriphagus halophilus]